ncbi:hypothetical protein GQ600_5249 [Phytophthora cactorum]|nr:hypothetical protein GQ600_5249 [Phytophthora cactorum]
MREPVWDRFKDIGDYNMCKCYGDSFIDSCDNVDSAVFCTPECFVHPHNSDERATIIHKVAAATIFYKARIDEVTSGN